MMRNQEKIVIAIVDSLLEMGFTDKNSIIQKTVEQTGVPRPTVRRILRDMRNEMLRKVRILQSEIDSENNV